MIVALHYLFTAVIMMIIAVIPMTQNAMAVSTTAAFASSPSRGASNESPDAIVDDGGNNIGWMDDWMLRFGGVARYV